MAANLPESLLRQLDPAEVRWYAVQAGWKAVEGIKRPVIVLNHPTEDLAQLQIPTAGNDRERAYMMGEVVQQIAEAENRSALEVLHDLTTLYTDTLHLQVQSRDAEAGTLPLDEGLRLFEGGRDLLLAAASSAHHPQAFYSRQSFAPAQDFLRRCRMGQTESSSFVATILAPVIPEVAPSLFDNGDLDWKQEPYERRVMMLLIEALQTVRDALDRGKPEELLQAVPSGISANLCDALAAMRPADVRAVLHIGVSWSRSRPRVPTKFLRRAAFAQFEFPIIREIGRQLWETIELKPQRITGQILSLRPEPKQLFTQFQGRVTIRALIEGRAARVRFHLNQSDFARACDALRDRRQVAVTGILERDPQTKMLELSQPVDFQIVQVDATVS